MKKITLILALVFFTTANAIAQEIKWVTFEEALALQKKKPKKIMMDVYTVWCGPCKMLDKNTFQNADVVKYVNDNYYAVKFDAEGNDIVKYKDASFSNPGYKEELATRRNGVHDLTRALGVNAYPTIVFFDDKGEVISPISGYRNPQQLELYLKLFSENTYKEIKTEEAFSNYISGFVPAFKG